MTNCSPQVICETEGGYVSKKHPKERLEVSEFMQAARQSSWDRLL